MSSQQRYIQKALAGIEDLLVGASSVTQSRNGSDVTINKINAYNIPFSGDAATADVITIGARIDTSVANLAPYGADAGATADTAYIDAGARSNLIVTEINDNLKEHYFNPISMLYEDSFGDYGYGEGNCDGNNSFLKKEERFDEDQIEKELEGNK